MKIVICSMYPPARISWGENEERFIGGTIEWITVDGVYLIDPDSFDCRGVSMSDVKHVSILKRYSTQDFDTYQVEGKEYIITDYGKEITCTCDGYKYRKTCKHINSFKEWKCQR